MVLKIRLLRLLIHTARVFQKVAKFLDFVGKHIAGVISIFGSILSAIASFQWKKWCKLAARIASICTTVTGAFSIFTSASTAASVTISAAGLAGTYATSHNTKPQTFEKIPHESPKLAKREVNLHYKTASQTKRMTLNKPVNLKR